MITINKSTTTHKGETDKYHMMKEKGGDGQPNPWNQSHFCIKGEGGGQLYIKMSIYYSDSVTLYAQSHL